jgi:hypothetical protein
MREAQARAIILTLPPRRGGEDWLASPTRCEPAWKGLAMEPTIALPLTRKPSPPLAALAAGGAKRREAGHA